MTDEHTGILAGDGDALSVGIVRHGRFGIQLHIGKKGPDKRQRHLVGRFVVGDAHLCGCGTDAEQTFLRFGKHFVSNGGYVNTEFRSTQGDSGFYGFGFLNGFLFHDILMILAFSHGIRHFRMASPENAPFVLH